MRRCIKGLLSSAFCSTAKGVNYQHPRASKDVGYAYPSALAKTRLERINRYPFKVSQSSSSQENTKTQAQ